ncbi:unnamed protein product, partial [Nesidiocoris tenuis]
MDVPYVCYLMCIYVMCFIEFFMLIRMRPTSRRRAVYNRSGFMSVLAVPESLKVS